MSFDGITFSPDYKTLYFDEEMGNLHRAPVNEDGMLGEPTLIDNLFEAVGTVEGLGLLDGMTADACGNVYVVDMEGRVIRATPSNEIEVAVDLTSEYFPFIPAVNFGSGVGGWKRDHLYIISFDVGIYEVEIGAIGKPEPPPLKAPGRENRSQRFERM